MKKKIISFAICLSAAFVWSCNNSGDTTTSDADSDNMSGDTTENNTSMNMAPLSQDDSAFVMEAAAANMTEVQLGQIAQQQASNQRVKDFGNMMVTDHTQANDQLKDLASGHGISLPDALPADKQKMVDDLKSLNGTAFDKKYMSMMVEDHQEDVAKFKTESNSANDPQLKQWATTTTPVLQKHLDSAQAINKAIK